MSREAHEGLYQISITKIKAALGKLTRLNNINDDDPSQSFQSINETIKLILPKLLKQTTLHHEKTLSGNDPDSVMPYLPQILNIIRSAEFIRDTKDSPEKEVYGSKIEALEGLVNDLLRHRQWLVLSVANNIVLDLQPLLNDESLNLEEMDTALDHLYQARDLLSKSLPEEPKITKAKHAEAIFEQSGIPEIERLNLYKDVNILKMKNANLIKELHNNIIDALDHVNALKEQSISETQSSEESTSETSENPEMELSIEKHQTTEYLIDQTLSEEEKEVELEEAKEVEREAVNNIELGEDESSSEEIIFSPEKKTLESTIINQQKHLPLPLPLPSITECTTFLTMKYHDSANTFEFNGKNIEKLIPEKLKILTALENELDRLKESGGPNNNKKYNKMETATNKHWVSMILFSDKTSDLGANLRLILNSAEIKMPEDRRWLSNLRAHHFHKGKPKKTKSESNLKRVFNEFTKRNIIEPKVQKK